MEQAAAARVLVNVLSGRLGGRRAEAVVLVDPGEAGRPEVPLVDDWHGETTVTDNAATA